MPDVFSQIHQEAQQQAGGDVFDQVHAEAQQSAAPNDFGTKFEDFSHGFGMGALKNIPFVGKYFGNPSQAGVVNPGAESAGETTGRVYEQGLEMAATGGPLKAGAKTLATKLPWLGRAAAPLLRVGAEAVNTGASAAIHGQPVGTSAALGAGGATVGELGQLLAPKLAESALGITNRMRGRGRTIGQAVLDETSGLRPSTIEQAADTQIGTLTGQMEDAVHQATAQGATGTTDVAHDVLDEAIANMPRNARALRDKLQSLRSLLDLDQVPVGPMRGQYSPDELLEMKRGIGKEIQTWPPEWQRIDDVKRVQQKLYGAIDGELDRLVPGNAELNQRISSLIPASRQAEKLSDSAGVSQRVMHRVGAHTGALASSMAGGALGYQKGGLPGAAAGSVAGAIVPELLASPTAQMAVARLIRSGVAPYAARAIVAAQSRSQVKLSDLANDNSQ